MTTKIPKSHQQVKLNSNRIRKKYNFFFFNCGYFEQNIFNSQLFKINKIHIPIISLYSNYSLQLWLFQT